MIVADTDILIDTLNGYEPSASRVSEAIEAGILTTTAVTVFELMSGAKSKRAAAAVEALLGAMRVLVFDSQAGHQAAKFRRRLEREGRKIGLADYLIAGICHTHSATLWTRNTRHFDRIEELRVESLD